MITILTIIGARPQIIKAAALSRAINNTFKNKIREIIIHTGQHYDDNMSQVFFDELNIPQPDYNLNVGSGSHGAQTAKMIEGIEELIIKLSPNYVTVYGDTNSTLAGAIAASKLHVPIIHIEAGIRSFNKKMPEEINRIMCDHASTLLFTPTKTGYNNLKKEGIINNSPPYTFDNQGVFHCGDIMFDNTVYFSKISKQKSEILSKNNLTENNFILTTLHRDNNTDDPERLESIILALIEIVNNNTITIVFPIHPRTEKLLEKNLNPNTYKSLVENKKILLIKPVSFLDMIELERNARFIITDSGGVQKEAYFFNKSSIILRPETEWIEIVENGAAVIANSNKQIIIENANNMLNSKCNNFNLIFGNGNAAEFICQEIIKDYNSKN